MKRKIAIVGASGYSGEELVRLLLSHPHVELTTVTSRQYAGQTVAQVFPRFASHPRSNALRFVEPNPALLAREAELVFLALPHGVAAEYAVPLLNGGCRVIDLSADFRLKNPKLYRDSYGCDHPAPELLGKAVYGLPEVYRNQIQHAQLVASPGCYPTSILLPTVPLLRAGLIRPQSIIANSLSGVSGAGRKAQLDYLFCECHESMRPYSVPKHRHLSEIEEQLSLVAGTPIILQFTPHLIPVNRGILTTIYFDLHESTPTNKGNSTQAKENVSLAPLNERLSSCYEAAYSQEPFVRLLKDQTLPDTKNVVGSNLIEIAWRLDPRTNRLIVMSAEDNILKGASGQAVQSMNIMCGLPETDGLM
jgi:N-acetyl-gamma-glutamyl-phosphate reductase